MKISGTIHSVKFEYNNKVQYGYGEGGSDNVFYLEKDTLVDSNGRILDDLEIEELIANVKESKWSKEIEFV